MIIKKLLFTLPTIALTLVLSSCNCGHKTSKRETIFDKIVSIPKKPILDIPHLPPYCDEIPGLKKGYANIKDGQLYYEEEGRGIPLVLISGGPGHPHHGFHPYFSRIKDVARIIYYDQRGTGKSSYDDSGKTYTIKQAVEDLDDLRKALKIEKWAVLGWSYGGLLAQCYALTYPNRCSGLILVAATSGVPEGVTKPVQSRMFISQAEDDAIKNLREKLFTGELTVPQSIYNQQLAGNWKRSYYYKPTKEEIIRAAHYNCITAPGFIELMRPQANLTPLEGKFDDFEIPTLITEAKWDLAWYNPNRIEVMQKNHPHAQVEFFEKSGHSIFADEPEKFFPLLKDFLKKSNTIKINYKPGNRLTKWPEPPKSLELWKFMGTNYIKDENKLKKYVFEVYKQAIKENEKDMYVWYQLIKYFITTRSDLEKCLIALQRLETTAKKNYPKFWKAANSCIIAWQGHILDLLQRRDEAVMCYKKSLEIHLEIHKGKKVAYFTDSIFIYKDWLEERLKIPFEWRMENKSKIFGK